MARRKTASRNRRNAARPRRTYHHGDLRQSLIHAGLELLQLEGAQALTLRAVARRASVSQTAPYRHFRDRRALVGAVAQQAFARMGEAIQRAVQHGEPGLPALRRGLAAYVRFAVAHQAEYRVMFGAELVGRRDMPELSAAAHGVFGILRDGIASLQERGLLGGGDATDRAISAWATLHGLAMLALDGQTAVTGRSIEALVDAASDVLLAGMDAAPRKSRSP
jgi:AcrR family transcriptional regulator